MVKCQISGLDIKPDDAVVLNRGQALRRINRLTEEVRTIRKLLNDFGPEQSAQSWMTAFPGKAHYECKAINKELIDLVVSKGLRNLFVPYREWMQKSNRLKGHLQRQGIERIDSVAGSRRFIESEGKT